MTRKRTRILTKGALPWSTNPTEARRIYMRIYREAHKTDVETALLKHLGIPKKRK